jgi:dTDP-4-dehydrorhamnose reductase
MPGHTTTPRILILGGSGFIGHALYKELQSFFQVYGTHTGASELFQKNQAFVRYDCNQDDLQEVLDLTKPDLIIVAHRSNVAKGVRDLKILTEYCQENSAFLMFLSHVMVFDAVKKFPSYTQDRPQSESQIGRYFMTLERIVQALPSHLYCIVRLSMVLGFNSPLMELIKKSIASKTPIEVFPNLIVSATSINLVVRHMHYLINKKAIGIYHIASQDVMHHSDLIQEICQKLAIQNPLIKNVYHSNDDQYLALLSRGNQWPDFLDFTLDQVLDTCTLSHIDTPKSMLQIGLN